MILVVIIVIGIPLVVYLVLCLRRPVTMCSIVSVDNLIMSVILCMHYLFILTKYEVSVQKFIFLRHSGSNLFWPAWCMHDLET